MVNRTWQRVRRSSIAATCIIALAVSSACVAQAPPYEVVPLEWTGGVAVTHSDVAYGTLPEHRADLYLSNGTRGTIVFLHGGGWVAGDKTEYFPSVLLRQVTRGYDVVSINYRLAPADPFPAAVHDAATAISWVRSQGPTHGLDTSRVILAGHSAGANIAALTAFGANDEFPGGDIPRVHGVVLFAGLYDFVNTQASASTPHDDWSRRLDGPRGWLRNRSNHGLASPVTWLDRRDPVALVVHGASDPIVSVEQARALRRRAAQVGHSMTGFEVTTSVFGEQCNGHLPWCGLPSSDLDRFVDSVPVGPR
jgi:acetyl esterase/lipase